ncbi:hypothetical protein J7372_19570, partial [Xanthomonas phaseoli pv. dieffenbachiae]|nr:hypothetical protein [Xanthomonas phaseoli pv. dieffenbachiae]MBO9776604.1 hypothetical protein [Xanthomonas phaseoli pv. dieffenbachiae]MBO9781485.1 hypothetical protein [Xanthomonas phaseoli pv. dieffenbachiae]MBO9797800.1 hypothetical protein [Xanthomonas phaseoli pv. dieffenbachiae]MBO9805242.1 hypothetical protein [Xanthomonas phaseoli pv. dieffenbachiae]
VVQTFLKGPVHAKTGKWLGSNVVAIDNELKGDPCVPSLPHVTEASDRMPYRRVGGGDRLYRCIER